MLFNLGETPFTHTYAVAAMQINPIFLQTKYLRKLAMLFLSASQAFPKRPPIVARRESTEFSPWQKPQLILCGRGSLVFLPSIRSDILAKQRDAENRVVQKQLSFMPLNHFLAT